MGIGIEDKVNKFVEWMEAKAPRDGIVILEKYMSNAKSNWEDLKVFGRDLQRKVSNLKLVLVNWKKDGVQGTSKDPSIGLRVGKLKDPYDTTTADAETQTSGAKWLRVYSNWEEKIFDEQPVARDLSEMVKIDNEWFKTLGDEWKIAWERNVVGGKWLWEQACEQIFNITKIQVGEQHLNPYLFGSRTSTGQEAGRIAYLIKMSWMAMINYDWWCYITGKLDGVNKTGLDLSEKVDLFVKWLDIRRKYASDRRSTTETREAATKLSTISFMGERTDEWEGGPLARDLVEFYKKYGYKERDMARESDGWKFETRDSASSDFREYFWIELPRTGRGEGEMPAASYWWTGSDNLSNRNNFYGYTQIQMRIEHWGQHRYKRWTQFHSKEKKITSLEELAAEDKKHFTSLSNTGTSGGNKKSSKKRKPKRRNTKRKNTKRRNTKRKTVKRKTIKRKVKTIKRKNKSKRRR